MLGIVIYAMVYLGSALMVYNIYGFVKFARNVQGNDDWGRDKRILYIPIILLVFFLLGYLIVGVLGNPDIVMASILFFGSVFVSIMYHLLDRITKKIVENERLSAELMAAEKSNEAKTEFLATISHEMRTPMNVSLGLDKLALKDQGVPQQTREKLEKIGLSAQHLLGLINNILDLSEMESKTQALRQGEFSLRNAISQVSVIAQTLCEERGLTYDLSVADNARDCCIGDEMRLKNTLLSMLDNAVKFTDPPGTVSFSVEVESMQEDAQSLRFVVTDTGIGISPEFIPKMFNAFEQEDVGSTNQHGGSGLSMAVAKRSVEAMGGSISVNSAKGVGSTFTVVIPLAVVHHEKPEKPAARPQSTGVQSLEGKRVLIVEDQDANAEIVADLLELEGVESERAENGQIAVDMVKASDLEYYDAILMDLRMPIMDGLTATRQIRNLNRDDASTIPIIALTANAFQSDVQQSLDAGMNAHLAKPTDVDLMYKTLKEHMHEKAQ